MSYHYFITRKNKQYRYYSNHYRLLEKQLQKNENWKPGSLKKIAFFDYSNVQRRSKIAHFPIGHWSMSNKVTFHKTFKKFIGIHIPESYLVHNRKIIGAKELLTDQMWYLKPASNFGGKGIRIDTNASKLAKLTAKKTWYILQKSVDNLLLYKGRKFDLRVYVLFVYKKGKPIELWMYKNPIVRCSSYEFDPNSNKRAVQITNYCYQKNIAKFKKSDCIKMLTDLEEHKKIRANLKHTLKHMAHVMFSSLARASKKQHGYWLAGLDFIVDANLKPWFLEVNFNPDMTFDTKRIKVCQTITETLVQHTLPYLLTSKARLRMGSEWSFISKKGMAFTSHTTPDGITSLSSQSSDANADADADADAGINTPSETGIEKNAKTNRVTKRKELKKIEKIDKSTMKKEVAYVVKNPKSKLKPFIPVKNSIGSLAAQTARTKKTQNEGYVITKTKSGHPAVDNYGIHWND